MDQKIENLIEEELQNCIVIEEANVTYLGAKIVDFKTHYDDGKYFTHANGDRYGLAFLNVFTKEGEDEIFDAINSFPTKSITTIKEIIKKNRLKKYIHGNTKRFLETKTGDEGSVYMEDLNNYSSVGFVNQSAENRRRNK